MIFDHYIIRPITINDAQQYFSLVQNNAERIAKYFPITFKSNTDISSTQKYLEDRILRMAKKEFFTFVICDTSADKIVGAIFLKDIDWNIPKCEMGFFIDKDYEGKGIITKAISELVTYCFEELQLNKFFMRIAPDNMASRKVAEKNNFESEGILRNDFKTSDGRLTDVMYYGLIKTKT